MLFSLSVTPSGTPVNTFNDGDWLKVGKIFVDGTPSGVGNETLDISSATFDFNQYAMGSLLTPFGEDYTTELSNISGTVDFSDGNVAGINLLSGIEFAFDGTDDPYEGSFTINGGEFALFVNDSVDSPFGPITLQWDFDGSASGTGKTVPEPSSLLGLGALMLSAFGMKRRRK